jgi:hypothetical protein
MINIKNKVYAYKASQQRVYPINSNRASVLGHPCERYLVYMRTDWQRMELPPVDREFIFEGGRVIEQLALRELQDAGFEVTNQGRDFKDDEHLITGHIDCFVADLSNGAMKYPCEIKGISPFDFPKINTLADMTKSPKTWMRAYPAQLQLYLYLAEKSEGLFYIKNKLSFEPKEIWTTLDYEYVETLLQRAKRINDHVVNKTLPDRINEYKTCKDCAAKLFCRPDIVFGEGINFIDDKEVEDKLDRRIELYTEAKEYETLDKEIKEGLKTFMKDRMVVLCGKWLIEKKINAKGAISFEFTNQNEKQE